MWTAILEVQWLSERLNTFATKVSRVSNKDGMILYDYYRSSEFCEVDIDESAN